MVRIENLIKHYGTVRALDGLSLNVEPGVVYGFLGPNGAGKTTTLRILAGLARADQGRAWILDEEIGRSEIDVRPLIGVLPEEPSFYTWMTAREYLRDFVAPLYGLDARAAGQRAGELLDTVGLVEAADRRIGGYSRGMKQRLGLAQALIHRPKVLLLDEHTASLDPKTAAVVMDLTERVVKENALTTLMVTHNMEQAIRHGDRLIMMHEGRIILDVSGEEKSRLTIPEVVERFGVVDEKLLLV